MVRAYAALKAARDERGSRTTVVLKPAPSTSAVLSERDAPAPGPSVPSEREPAVPSERGGEERPDDRPKCPDGHVLEEDFVSSVNELMGAFARPKGRKRGGVRHKKSSTPKKKAKKKKVCKCGRNHKAVRPRHRVPAGQLCLKGFKSWLIARRVRNRLAHAANGNTAFWSLARLSFVLSLVPLVPLVYHTEQELEHSVSVVLESAAVATGEVLDEFGSSARQVVRVLFQTILFVFLAILWAVTRSCRNRLTHALSGNIPCKLIELSNGESTWEVRKYRVWLGKDGQACSCRAYLNEGTCGHIDAAVDAAKQQGIIETKVRFTPTAKDRGLAALGSPSAQVRQAHCKRSVLFAC